MMLLLLLFFLKRGEGGRGGEVPKECCSRCCFFWGGKGKALSKTITHVTHMHSSQQQMAASGLFRNRTLENGAMCFSSWCPFKTTKWGTHRKKKKEKKADTPPLATSMTALLLKHPTCLRLARRFRLKLWRRFEARSISVPSARLLLTMGPRLGKIRSTGIAPKWTVHFEAPEILILAHTPNNPRTLSEQRSQLSAIERNTGRGLESSSKLVGWKNLRRFVQIC